MTTTTTPVSAAEGPGASAETVTSAPVPSGVRRLNPVDGLFLRAEHLDQIQHYAEELGRLTTQAGGAGTVYGYDLTLWDDDAGGVHLQASPGLAVSEEGGLLRSRTDIDVDLGRLELGVPGRFWVVEVVPAPPVLSGSEPAYTSVCATRCGPGSSIRPWRDDAVRIRVRAMSLEASWDWGSTARSALASAWFERERAAGGPWLTPGAAGTPVRRLSERPWEVPAPASAPTVSAVPLGLLLREKDAWTVDVWAARRDRATQPPEASWHARLGMRGWGSYRAQVLQFEDQVSCVSLDDDLREHVVELPPGGFLEVALDPDDDPVRRHLEQRGLWSERCRIIHCTADVAISAVALAQRLDRIPLNAEPPAIDFWVPDLPVDLPATRPEGPHGWIAFTRGVQLEGSRETSRGDARGADPSYDSYDAADAAADDPDDPDDPDDTGAPEAPGEFSTSLFEQFLDEGSASATEIDLYLVTAPRDRTRYGSAIAEVSGDERIGVARFSEGWRLQDSSSLDEARRSLPDGGWVDVAATTHEVSSEPLAAARARSLASALGLADSSHQGVYAFLSDGPAALYLMVRP